MNSLCKITAPIVLISSLYLSACDDRDKAIPVAMEVSTPTNSMYDEYGFSKEPVYIEGVITSERFTSSFLDGTFYTFGIETDKEIKTFYLSNGAQKADAILKQGDTVRLRIDLCDDIRRFYGREGKLELEDIISVNEKKIDW